MYEAEWNIVKIPIPKYLFCLFLTYFFLLLCFKINIHANHIEVLFPFRLWGRRYRFNSMEISEIRILKQRGGNYDVLQLKKQHKNSKIKQTNFTIVAPDRETIILWVKACCAMGVNASYAIYEFGVTEVIEKCDKKKE
jgi:hypothetical protein